MIHPLRSQKQILSKQEFKAVCAWIYISILGSTDAFLSKLAYSIQQYLIAKAVFLLAEN